MCKIYRLWKSSYNRKKLQLPFEHKISRVGTEVRNRICRPIKHSLLLEILVQQILHNHEYNIKKKNAQIVGSIEGKSCIPCMICKCNIEEFCSQTMNSIMENFLAINKGFWNHSYCNFPCYRQGNGCILCVKCECNIEEWCS